MNPDAAPAIELAATLDAGIGALRLDVPATARERLVAYVGLLAKWNRTYNLTAILEPARMVTHHLLDSLAALPALDARVAGHADVRVLDVGSGAGLPGLPIAIARPAWHVTMLEPVHKKAAFITQAIAELRIANANVVSSRVEDFRADAPYTIVISRAFADLAAFASSSGRHVAAGGALVAMKGVHPDEEINELPPSFAVQSVVPLDVPGIEGARHLLFVSPKAR